MVIEFSEYINIARSLMLINCFAQSIQMIVRCLKNVSDLLEHSLSVYTQVKNLDQLKRHLTNVE